MTRPLEASLGDQAAWQLLRRGLTRKTVWLIIPGIVATLASSLLAWLTVTLVIPASGSIPFSPSTTMVINGLDATWNITYQPFQVRIIEVQLLALSLAFLSLLLGIFRVISSKNIRGAMLIIAGVLGITAPIEFAYVLSSQGQALNAEFSQLDGLLGSLGQPNYSIVPGPGLFLSIIGPILLVFAGAFVLREKSSTSPPSIGQRSASFE